MALYAIGDPHLSFGTDKPMDVFGGRWENYVEKLEAGFSGLSESDVCVLCGDLSWASDLEGASEDLKFLSALPSKKIILKGNHDYWWSTVTKIKKHLDGLGIENMDILHNNCFFYNEVAICGTRGWFYEEEDGSAHDKKIMLREIGRLTASLCAAGNREKIVFLHYPPLYRDYICREITDAFREFGVRKCFYAHIHGAGRKQAFEGLFQGVDYRLVSADHLEFKPLAILE